MNRTVKFYRRRQIRQLKRLIGYKSIGSFHSEDVDALMSQPSEVYEIPELPFDPTLEADKLSGETETKAPSDFLLDRKQWTFLNHGAFGAALRVGYDRAEQWRCVVFCFFNLTLISDTFYSRMEVVTNEVCL